MRASNGISAFAADRAHLALLERAQELRLHVERQLADLVEEERAAARLRRRGPCASAFASVKAPRAWPKSSLSRSGRGHRRAVDGDERPVLAAALRRGCRARRAPCRCRVSPVDEDRRVAVGRRASMRS